jgi:hypothetical protein
MPSKEHMIFWLVYHRTWGNTHIDIFLNFGFEPAVDLLAESDSNQ